MSKLIALLAILAIAGVASGAGIVNGDFESTLGLGPSSGTFNDDGSLDDVVSVSDAHLDGGWGAGVNWAPAWDIDGGVLMRGPDISEVFGTAGTAQIWSDTLAAGDYTLSFDYNVGSATVFVDFWAFDANLFWGGYSISTVQDIPAGGDSRVVKHLVDDNTLTGSGTAIFNFTLDFTMEAAPTPGGKYDAMGIRFMTTGIPANIMTFDNITVGPAGSVAPDEAFLTILSGSGSVTVGTTNLTAAAGVTNTLQSTANLTEEGGVLWTDLYSVAGVTSTNWVIPITTNASFFRIETTY